MPALYLGHGAPPLLEDETWMAELGGWAASLPRPKAILIVSAHWESAPVTVSATTRVPLVYDFYGFPEHYYRMRYDAPPSPELAATVASLMPDSEPVRQMPTRGLDHGAWVPLTAMFPQADIPVLQMSMPDLDPQHLFDLGRRLAPLRDEGVLVVGSGFMTHGLPFIHALLPRQAGRAGMVGRVRCLGRRGAGARRHGRAHGVPQQGAGDAVRPSDDRALRPALCGSRRRLEARRRARHEDRRVLVRAREALG